MANGANTETTFLEALAQRIPQPMSTTKKMENALAASNPDWPNRGFIKN